MTDELPKALYTTKAHDAELRMVLRQLDETKTALREIRDLYDDSKSVGEPATMLYDARCIAIRVLAADESSTEAHRG